jgi:hypothetical protein
MRELPEHVRRAVERANRIAVRIDMYQVAGLEVGRPGKPVDVSTLLRAAPPNIPFAGNGSQLNRVLQRYLTYGRTLPAQVAEQIDLMVVARRYLALKPYLKSRARTSKWR